MSNKNSYRPNYAIPPGDVLDEHREAAGLTQAELAQRLGFSVKHINRLLAGLEPVTPETALKLESVFSLSAGIWLGLEAKYKEHQARLAEAASLESEREWLKSIPHRSIAKLGWIPEGSRGPELVRNLRSFFGVGSLNYLPNVWSDVQAAYRKTEAFASHEWALLAWLAKGERMATTASVSVFDGAALKSDLAAIKALSCLHGAEFEKLLVERCASHGIVLIFVPAPDGARVCGATRWLDKDKALIQLSLRYRTNDQFWFTLFHELGHVLLHSKREQFIDFERDHIDSAQEREADEFAAKHLVNQSDLAKFIEAGTFTTSSVLGFSEEQNVAPGIVVGQLQHRGAVPYNSVLSRLKVSFSFANQYSQVNA